MYITILAEYLSKDSIVGTLCKESQIMPYKALGSMFGTFAACSYLPELSYDPAEGVQLCKHSIFYLFFSQTLLEQVGRLQARF